MRQPLLGVLLLLALSPAVRPQDDKDKTKPDKPETSAAQAKKELEDMDAGFASAQRELFARLPDVEIMGKSQRIIEKDKIVEKQRQLKAEYGARAFAVIGKCPKETDFVVDALISIVRNTQGDPAAVKATDLLIRDHLASINIFPLLPILIDFPLDANERLFRALVAKARNADWRMSHQLDLAKFLKRKAESIRQIKTLDENAIASVEMRSGKEVLGRLAASDPAPFSNEAEKLFEAIVKEVGDDGKYEWTKSVAESELFEIRSLACGKQAPDIEGVDADGIKFKLSDYRGKVVVLDFWTSF